MNAIFSYNLKRFRLAKRLTQEQVAEKLNVNSQTVSRWECGTTLPDVLTLPELAKLYDVMVDDFYKKNSVAYGNYAQRLSSVYEQSHDPEDFMRCRAEYHKLMKEGELSTEDKWLYGWIHKCMMNDCKDIAAEWFDKAVNDDPGDDPANHHLACMQRIRFYSLIGKGDEIIAEQTEKAKLHPTNPREIDNLIVALIYAEKFEEAYAVFNQSVEKFTDDWRMYIHGGDIAKKLKKYDEALAYYDRAGEIGTYFCDELYCKANLYEDLGESEKAIEIYRKIADTLRQRGFDVEADMAEKNAEEVRRKENRLSD